MAMIVLSSTATLTGLNEKKTGWSCFQCKNHDDNKIRCNLFFGADAFHLAMPAAEVGLRLGQLVMAGIKKIIEHAEQVEVHKVRTFTQQKRGVREGVFKGGEAGFQFFQPAGFLRAPLVNAAAPELAFLETEILQFVGGGQFGAAIIFPVINIVQAESRAFDIVLNVMPENGLDAFEADGEKIELQFFVEIFGDDLRIVVRLEHDVFAVAQNGHAVISLSGQFPDEGTFLRKDVDEFEICAGEFEDALLRQAIGTPCELK